MNNEYRTTYSMEHILKLEGLLLEVFYAHNLNKVNINVIGYKYNLDVFLNKVTTCWMNVSAVCWLQKTVSAAV